MTQTIDSVKALEEFINDGIRPINDRDNKEIVTYINTNIEIKKLYEENDLNSFISKVQMKERALNSTNSERVKFRKNAFKELIEKYHELFY